MYRWLSTGTVKSVDGRVADMSGTTTSGVDLVGDETTLNIARAALLAALTGAFAIVGSIPIPFSPIPFTLQVLGVFLAGLLLGPVWGAASMLLYLVAGAVGAPVFAGGAAGIGVLAGQSGGYLFSYPIAAAATGYIAHGGLEPTDLRTVSSLGPLAGMTVAIVIIYALGTAQFAFVNDIGFAEALTLASLPFIPGDVLKMFVALIIVQSGSLN